MHSKTQLSLAWHTDLLPDVCSFLKVVTSCLRNSSLWLYVINIHLASLTQDAIKSNGGSVQRAWEQTPSAKDILFASEQWSCMSYWEYKLQWQTFQFCGDRLKVWVLAVCEETCPVKIWVILLWKQTDSAFVSRKNGEHSNCFVNHSWIVHVNY